MACADQASQEREWVIATNSFPSSRLSGVRSTRGPSVTRPDTPPTAPPAPRPDFAPAGIPGRLFSWTPTCRRGDLLAARGAAVPAGPGSRASGQGMSEPVLIAQAAAAYTF